MQLPSLLCTACGLSCSGAQPAVELLQYPTGYAGAQLQFFDANQPVIPSRKLVCLHLAPRILSDSLSANWLGSGSRGARHLADQAVAASLGRKGLHDRKKGYGDLERAPKRSTSPSSMCATPCAASQQGHGYPTREPTR
eukprot:366082-Chlamydomonas_euryale.AAC.34